MSIKQWIFGLSTIVLVHSIFFKNATLGQYFLSIVIFIIIQKFFNDILGVKQ